VDKGKDFSFLPMTSLIKFCFNKRKAYSLSSALADGKDNWRNGFSQIFLAKAGIAFFLAVG
jgi:hypothetical protein